MAGFTVTVDGLEQTRGLLSRVIEKDLPKNLTKFHAGQLRVLTASAESIFNSEKLRPDESGSRPGVRETGNFTFGKAAGGAFVGRVINDTKNNIYGVAYPDIARADSKTNGIWRVLEFGLTGARHSADAHELAPRGVAKFPTKFTFLPFGRGGIFRPSAKGSAPKGTLVTPRGQIVSKVAHPGIEPKRFIRRAFAAIESQLDQGYGTVAFQTFQPLK